MKNKAFYLILVLVLIFVAGFLFWKPKNSDVKNSSDQGSKSAQEDQVASNTSDSLADNATNTNKDTKPSGATSTKDNPDQSQAQYSGEGDIQSPDVAVFEVDYDGTDFSPKTTTISAGDIVVFKNNSSKDFWPASNNHPSHTLYPEFDPKKSIAAGGKFEFKFIKVGNWGFHDHKNSSATGTIIVK